MGHRAAHTCHKPGTSRKHHEQITSFSTSNGGKTVNMGAKSEG